MTAALQEAIAALLRAHPAYSGTPIITEAQADYSKAVRNAAEISGGAFHLIISTPSGNAGPFKGEPAPHGLVTIQIDHVYPPAIQELEGIITPDAAVKQTLTAICTGQAPEGTQATDIYYDSYQSLEDPETGNYTRRLQLTTALCLI